MACKGHVGDGSLPYCFVKSEKCTAIMLAFKMFYGTDQFELASRQSTGRLQYSTSKPTAVETSIYKCINFYPKHAVPDHVPDVRKQQLWLVYARCDFPNKQKCWCWILLLAKLAAIC